MGKTRPAPDDIKNIWDIPEYNIFSCYEYK